MTVVIDGWMTELHKREQVEALPNDRLAELLDATWQSQAARAWWARREAARRLRLLAECGPR